jgi:hypothetical protein
VTAGNGSNVILADGAAASVNVVAGTGLNTIYTGAGASGSITVGAHTGTDAITIGSSGTSLTHIMSISGLNNALIDSISFSDVNQLVGFTQVTAANVVASGGDTTQLASWVAAADGLGGFVAGAAHGVDWFQFQGNTYILESVAGATHDAGAGAAGNTLVELVGTGYTFSHTTANATGALFLLG